MRKIFCEKMKSGKGVFLILFCIICEATAGNVVMTGSGPVEGITVQMESSEVSAFLGIPFAEPPVGDLRFKRPEPKKPWQEVYKAAQKSPACLQKAWQHYYFEPNTDNMTEDCLYLNMWIPKKAGNDSLKHILIWFHGGAYNLGSGSMELYDGAFLADYGDVIVATFNYRLGVFGFMTALIEEAPGNMGIYDMIMAVKWIKENAEAFGGDPEQITLVGESSGAISIGMFMISATTKKLFKRVIMESGSAMHPYSRPSNPDILLNLSQRLSKLAGCANDTVTVKTHPQEVVKCLKSISYEDIIRAENEIKKSLPITFYPLVGEHVHPREAFYELRTGNFAHIEMLIGMDAEEGTMLLTNAIPDYFGIYGFDKTKKLSKSLAYQMVMSVYTIIQESGGKEIARFYVDTVHNSTSGDYTKAISDSIGDFMSTCSCVFHADFHSLAGNPVYFFVFSHRPSSSPLAEWMGATHFDEIQFIFGKPLRHPANYTSEEVALSRRMMDRWISFAKTGDPNVPGEVTWPRYTFEDPKYLDIDVKETIHTKPYGERCDFWRKRFKADIDEEVINKLKSVASTL